MSIKESSSIQSMGALWINIIALCVVLFIVLSGLMLYYKAAVKNEYQRKIASTPSKHLNNLKNHEDAILRNNKNSNGGIDGAMQHIVEQSNK